MAVLLPSRVGRHELAGIGDGEAGVLGFVVDVHDNLVPSLSDECQGVDEDVTSDCLDNVLDEFPAVGLQPPPHLRPVVTPL